jgi:hypothetical protein
LVTGFTKYSSAPPLMASKTVAFCSLADITTHQKSQESAGAQFETQLCCSAATEGVHSNACL